MKVVNDSIILYQTGHQINMTDLSLVLQKVRDLQQLSNILGMPPKTVPGDREQGMKKISDYLTSKNPDLSYIREMLEQCNETQAVVCLMDRCVFDSKYIIKRINYVIPSTTLIVVHICMQ